MTQLPSVEDARARMLEGVDPGGTEPVPLAQAIGRVLAEPVVASRDQPPFDASAMDGWAIRSMRAGEASVTLAVVGESAAGRPYIGEVREEEAVRIFTGAPVPPGCGRVVPQEDAAARDLRVTLGPRSPEPTHVRPRGGDFRAGQVLLTAGVRLDPWRLGLAAAAGAAEVRVAARPGFTLISTGEEIVAPGGEPRDSQIYDSASYALRTRAEHWGGCCCDLRAAGDTEDAIARAVADAPGELVVFIGGASVGDYDLVKPTLSSRFGLVLSVEGVNVRPGKPTWFGRLADGRRVLGLPGNPASALVCAELFFGPLLRAWQGVPPGPALRPARLTHDLAKSGPRETWMRARLDLDATGVQQVTAFADQDSSLVTVFAEADALIRRPAGAGATARETVVEVLRLDRL